MKTKANPGPKSSAALVRWGKKLAADVDEVMAKYPDADPEDVRLTLISLQLSPLERLNRSLRRGRGFAAFKERCLRMHARRLSSAAKGTGAERTA